MLLRGWPVRSMLHRALHVGCTQVWCSMSIKVCICMLLQFWPIRTMLHRMRYLSMQSPWRYGSHSSRHAGHLHTHVVHCVQQALSPPSKSHLFLVVCLLYIVLRRSGLYHWPNCRSSCSDGTRFITLLIASWIYCSVPNLNRKSANQMTRQSEILSVAKLHYQIRLSLTDWFLCKLSSIATRLCAGRPALHIATSYI